MEKQFKLKTSDSHIIYGTLNTGASKSNSLVIFVHGLTGNSNEHIFYNAAHFFPQNGFDVVRFDLYSGDEGGRALSNCTVRIHAMDLETVFSSFKQDYKNIHIVGHSLGAPTIVLADISEACSIVFWDPSDMLGLKDIVEGQERPLKQDKPSNNYIVDWGVEYLLGESMAQEFKTLRPTEVAKKIQIPTKIIAAEGGNPRGSQEYFDCMNGLKELVVIKGAGHTFDEEGVEDQLFEETLKWVSKYSV
ncbi:MAG: alpha/beta fold hydrolase [Candidatus Andersenbacteria bacterium]